MGSTLRGLGRQCQPHLIGLRARKAKMEPECESEHDFRGGKVVKKEGFESTWRALGRHLEGTGGPWRAV